MPLYSYSAKHQQRARIFTAPHSGRSTHLGDKVLHPVRLSVCPIATVYSKSESRGNLLETQCMTQITGTLYFFPNLHLIVIQSLNLRESHCN